MIKDAQPNPFSDTIYRRPFIFFFRQHPKIFLAGVISLFFTNLFDVLTPLAIKKGIDALELRDTEALTAAIALYLALMVGTGTFRFAWRIFFGRFNSVVADHLRGRIFDKLTTLGPTFYHKTPAGQILSLINSDVNAFRHAIGPGTLILLDAAFYIAMIVPLMMYLSWSWTWKTLLFLPLVPPFLRRMEALIHQRFRSQQDRLAEMSSKAQEIVTGIRLIKSYAQETNQTLSFDRYSEEFERACNQVAKVDAAFNPVMQLAITLGSVSLLWFCTPEVMQGSISLGTFVAFHEYIRRMVWPMSAIGMGISIIEQGRASFARISELLLTPTDIPDLGDVEMTRFEKLEVRNLTYRYDGAPDDVIKNISFELRAGETLGLVGPVGAGKTTLLHLLCRLFPSQPGSITINGQPIESLTAQSLRKMISLVPQEAFLFSDTVSANLELGLKVPPDRQALVDVSESVNLRHEIDALPDGFASYLGERGVNLSGGQKQRLTIARAMIRRSPVLMLDDSLSNVDAKTELSIVNALNEERVQNPEQTVIFVSHRLTTLKRADRIIVLNRGEIEAIGTHDELLVMSPTYAHLHEMQDLKPSGETNGLWV